MSYANFVQAFLGAPLSATGTEVLLQTPEPPYQLPPQKGGVLILTDSLYKPGVVEVVRYAAREGETLTGLVRGLEGTSPRDWPAVSVCYQSFTAGEAMNQQKTAKLIALGIHPLLDDA